MQGSITACIPNNLSPGYVNANLVKEEAGIKMLFHQ